jgi:hypothetical protein
MLNGLLNLTIFLAVAAGIYAIYRFFSGMRMTDNEEFYKQRGVTINYKSKTIQIGSRSYDVNKVTGISTVTQPSGNRNNYYTEIQVDDMKKPVHKIAVIGSHSAAQKFTQRICVALRKAGGPDFY